ncbi:MAG TPA: Bcr/CflA family multidrug efflux MFS transporter [Pseudomonadales bacterium]|nr:Bcr/CflA family multidrug efflux MFS transporter [Pseudomonadales bacterium]
MNPESSPVMIPGWLVLLGALTALAPLSIDMYLPALPVIEQGLMAPAGSISLTLAAFFVGMALGQLFYGPLSDRFGRKPPLYAGLALYVLASLGCMLADNITMLIMCRFLQALGGCAGAVIARAIVRDRCSANESARAFSMLMLVMGLAPILAPVFGGWLLVWVGWRWLFLALALFGAACMLVMHKRLEETHDTRHAEPLELGSVLKGYARLCRNRAFLGYTLSGGLGMAGMFAYITGSPFIFIELYHLSPQHYSLLFGSNALALITASQLNVWQLQRMSLTRLLRRTLWMPAIAATALLLLSFTPWLTWWLLWIGFFVFVGSLGFINPNASAAALATHGQQAGMASALMGALQFGLATLSGSMVGLWHDGSSLPLVVIMMVCGVGAWLSHYCLIKPHEGSK